MTAGARGAAREIGGLATVLALIAAPAAAGHGPCSCLEPAQARPGDRVQLIGPGANGPVGYPAYRVVFNPRPSDLGIAPPHLARFYRGDQPTATLLDRPRMRVTRRASFGTPRVAPGRYLVLIYDGYEARQHSTWEHLTVERAVAGSAGDSGLSGAVIVGAAGGVSLAACAIAMTLRRRRKRRELSER